MLLLGQLSASRSLGHLDLRNGKSAINNSFDFRKPVLPSVAFSFFQDEPRRHKSLSHNEQHKVRCGWKALAMDESGGTNCSRAAMYLSITAGIAVASSFTLKRATNKSSKYAANMSSTTTCCGVRSFHFCERPWKYFYTPSLCANVTLPCHTTGRVPNQPHFVWYLTPGLLFTMSTPGVAQIKRLNSPQPAREKSRIGADVLHVKQFAVNPGKLGGSVIPFSRRKRK